MYICLYQEVFPFIIFIFQVAAFSFSPKRSHCNISNRPGLVLLACRDFAEKSADSLVETPLMLLILSLSFTFCHFNYSIPCCVPLWVDFVWDSASWTWMFPGLGKFSAIRSSTMFSIPFCLPSPSGIPVIQMLIYLLSQRSLKLSSFIFIIFSSQLSSMISTTLSSSAQIHSSGSLFNLVYFLLQLLFYSFLVLLYINIFVL